MKKKILVVEDDFEMASFVMDALISGGFDAVHAVDGRFGFELASSGLFDLVVLDRMLPTMTGIEVVKALRSRENAISIIILSALGDVSHRVDGLTAGSNDYLPKPFEVAELLARIKVLLRTQSAKAELIRYQDLELDKIARILRVENRTLPLQPKEFQLLAFLMDNAEEDVTRSMLLKQIWDYDFDPGTNVVDVHVSRLRKKLGELAERQLVHTVKGVGYRFGSASR